MRKTVLFVLLLLLCGAGFAQEKANLSGTWTLDKERSFSNGPQFDQNMTIEHSGDKLKLDAKQKTPRGEVAIHEEYAIDGKEASYTPQGATPNMTGKRKVSWLPNGRGILVEDEISTDGKVVRNITRKMALSADGKSMLVDLFIDDNRGSFEQKRVYNKAM